jgi:lactoylglutathione lyase
LKTLHFAYRVADLNRSLAFYSAMGYIEVGQVTGDDGGRLVFLKFPDDPAVAIELVYRRADGPVEVGNGFSHLAIQVDALAETLEMLIEAGLEPGPIQYPAGPDGPKTSWLTDPDGYRIELVEWPPGHAMALPPQTLP